MDSEVSNLRSLSHSMRSNQPAPSNSLDETRNKAERDRVDTSVKIEAHTREIDELETLIEQMTTLRNRKVKERADMLDTHAVQVSSVAMLADRALRSKNS